MIIGSKEPYLFNIEAKNAQGVLLTIGNGDVTWYVCPLPQPVCFPSDKQDDKGSILSLSVDQEETPEDIRLEAVFHGRKAVREDFRFIE